VATVCTKLFNIVKPHVTIFGKKDYQQYVAIRQMVRDMNMDLEVVGMDTTREADGLALSSRNVYLTPEQRKSALSLSRSLVLARDLYGRGERRSEVILAKVRERIAGCPETQIDYARICDTRTMRDVDQIEGECILALAVRVGKTRLIDNHVFGEPLDIDTPQKTVIARVRRGAIVGRREEMFCPEFT
jgi:pantoate--beta-alanine ligase